MRPNSTSLLRSALFSVVIISAAAIAPGAATPAAGARIGKSVPFVEPNNCAECAWCTDGHKDPPDQFGTIGGIHSWCMALPDCTHPGCGTALAPVPRVDTPALEDLVQLALGGDVAAVRKMVLLYPEKTSYNITRQALQIEGCQPDVIVAQIPLTGEALGFVQKYAPAEVLYSSR